MASMNGVGYAYQGQWSPFRPSPGMIEYNTKAGTWKNVSAPHTTVWGKLEAMPELGDEGLLIALGGDVFGLPEDTGKSFETVTLYDPTTGKTYTQPTGGSIPQPRDYFCSTIARSTEGTYELYIYGGGHFWDGQAYSTSSSTSDCYYDAHVLTIPGFQWFDVPPATHQYPLADHTCNVVGNSSQVLVVGGVNWSSRDLSDLGVRDPMLQGLSIFDLNSMEWKDSYEANAPAYSVNDNIKKWYSTTPANQVQWASGVRDLVQADNAGLFQTKDPGSSSSTPVGAIVGGVIGALAFIVLLIAGFWFYRRRQRSRGEPVVPAWIHKSSADPPATDTEKEAFDTSGQQPPSELPDNSERFGKVLSQEVPGHEVRYELEQPNEMPREMYAPAKIHPGADSAADEARYEVG